MPDPKIPGSSADADAERLDGTAGGTDDSATTMRLRVLDLEGELWPEDQGRTDDEDAAGAQTRDGAPGDGDQHGDA